MGSILKRLNKKDLQMGVFCHGILQNGPDAGEMAESIRFYLHGAGLETADFEPGREAWFEFLPARRAGTIRPALMRGGRLVKKGLAAS